MAPTGKSGFLSTATESTTSQRLAARTAPEVRKVAEWCFADFATASKDFLHSLERQHASRMRREDDMKRGRRGISTL